MKKILIFSLAYFPRHVGGAEVAIKEIVERIPPAEYEFHMICLQFDSTQPRIEQVGNVLVHRVGLGRKGLEAKNSYGLGFYLSKVLFIPLAALHGLLLNRKHHYAGMWAMMSYMVFPISLMRLVGNRTPYVLTIQEGDPFEHVFDRLYIKPFRWLLLGGFRNATVITAISNYLGAWARTLGFTGDVVLVPNAVNTKVFSRVCTEDELKAARMQLKKNVGDVVLITTSRLVKKNAVDVVIQALSELPPHVSFAILGTGPDESMLKEQVRALKLEQRVVFLDHVSHDDMPALLQAADIFVRPSRSEGMGASFVEAMAAGIPVIATQEGGIADFLFDAYKNPGIPTTGWAVASDQPTEIVRAVREILADPHATKTVVDEARRMVYERYDWDTIALQMKLHAFDRLG